MAIKLKCTEQPGMDTDRIYQRTVITLTLTDLDFGTDTDSTVIGATAAGPDT